MYNEVNFYDPRHPDFEPDPEAIEALRRWREEKSKITVYENCTVEWLEWFTSRRACGFRGPRWSVDRNTAEGCRVTVKGKMATIEFPDGKVMRKRIGTRGFSFTQRQQPTVSTSENGEFTNTCGA